MWIKIKKQRKKQNDNQILTVQIFQQLCVSQSMPRKLSKKVWTKNRNWWQAKEKIYARVLARCCHAPRALTLSSPPGASRKSNIGLALTTSRGPAAPCTGDSGDVDSRSGEMDLKWVGTSYFLVTRPPFVFQDDFFFADAFSPQCSCCSRLEEESIKSSTTFLFSVVPVVRRYTKNEK